jgi:hypothetical protein
MDIFNTSGVIYMAMAGWNDNVTGSLFLVLLIMFLLILGLCIVWRIPMELIAVIMIPVSFTFVAVDGAFSSILAIDFLIISFLIVKNIFK